MLRFVASLFGCAHRRCTFPITAKGRAREGKPGNTYIVCLNCGKEFPYDWQKMKVGPAVSGTLSPKRAHVA